VELGYEDRAAAAANRVVDRTIYKYIMINAALGIKINSTRLAPSMATCEEKYGNVCVYTLNDP